jgi:hypothetical protein
MKTMFVLASAICVCITLLTSDNGPDSPPDQTFVWDVPGRPLKETLAQLARASGKDAEDYRTYRRQGAAAGFSKKGSVTRIAVGDKTYAIAVQTVEPVTVPGMAAQQVVLVTAQGTILDRVQCDINSRYGTMRTEVLPKPDADGARVVIRFVGHKAPDGRRLAWHNWHTIVHEGKGRTFREKETDQPSIWNEKGLCRIKVAEDKFSLVFPDVRAPEE